MWHNNVNQRGMPFRCSPCTTSVFFSLRAHPPTPASQFCPCLPPQVALNSNANFANIFNSLVTLFRCSTGEDWQDIMYDLINSQIAASNGSWVARMMAYVPAVLYFVAFEFLSSFIVLNLFIMIITENFESTSSNGTEWMSVITILRFRECWMAVDNLGTEFVELKKVKEFLQSIASPLGLDPNATFQEYFNFVLDLDLTFYECVALPRLPRHAVTFSVHSRANTTASSYALPRLSLPSPFLVLARSRILAVEW